MPACFQHLRDHAGQPFGLLGDDLNAAQRVALHGVVIGDRLRPALDGGQRGAQLVRDLRDELGPRLLRDGDLFGHLVERVGEIADLVVAELFHLDAVAALGDAPGDVREVFHRVGHARPEPQHHADDVKADERDQRDGIERIAAGDEIHRREQQNQRADAGDDQLVFQPCIHRLP